MKIKELREMNIDQLKKTLAEKREQTRRLKFDMATKQVKNNKEIMKEKKDIARILTLINEDQTKK